MSSPLGGLRVLEFAHVAAGPFAGMLLADLGADVVKVEPPDGDHMRRWPPLVDTGDGEFSLNFASINRSKRSVVADLKNPADRERVLRLSDTADVIIENYRPGVLARLGLGFDQLAARHPDGLVYCSVTGYGQDGPYRHRGAFDVVVQAESGLMSVTGDKDGAPVKCGVPVGDFVAGLYASFSVLAALEVRRREQRSVYIDCPMLSTLLAISALQTSQYWGTAEAPVALGSAHPRNAPYQAFRAADTSFALAAGTDALWRQVADAVGRADLAADPRFRTQRDRAEHQDSLTAELAPVFAAERADYWIKELTERGVPCGPVNTYADILADPHVAAIGLIAQLALPDGAVTPTVRFPTTMTGVELPDPSTPPRLGGDTETVLAEWLS
jgi:succinate---hydroxymethylglutarate CoA-transferase